MISHPLFMEEAQRQRIAAIKADWGAGSRPRAEGEERPAVPRLGQRLSERLGLGLIALGERLAGGQAATGAVPRPSRTVRPLA